MSKFVFSPDVPENFRNPDFSKTQKCHDWRNHVGAATQEIWATFTDEQKAAIAVDAESRANNEEWD